MSSMNLKDLQNQYEGEGIPWRSYCIYYHYLLVNRVICMSSWIWFFYSSESVLFYTLLLLLYHTLILWAKNTNTDCVSRWEWLAYWTQYYKRSYGVISGMTKHTTSYHWWNYYNISIYHFHHLTANKAKEKNYFISFKSCDWWIISHKSQKCYNTVWTLW